MKKTTYPEQVKLFNEWKNETFTWMNNDVKKYMMRSWWASVKANQ